MNQAIQAAVEADAAAVAVVLASFLRRVVSSRDHTDVVVAAGAALQDLDDLGSAGGLGQESGRTSRHVLKPI